MSDATPYHVTLAVAAAAWILTSTTERSLQAPILTYWVESVPSGTNYLSYIHVKNITHSFRFKNVDLLFSTTPDNEILTAKIIPIRESWEGDQPGDVAKNTYHKIIGAIQPSGEFEISMLHTANKTPFLRFRSDDPVDVVGPDLRTLVIENEFSINIWAFVIIVAYLVIYLLSASIRALYFGSKLRIPE
jgi:hypothetical protein